MKRLLKKFSEAFGVSGNEGEIRALILEEVEKYSDKTNIDIMGNLIVFKKGRPGGKKILLAAHMDEIGVMATYTDKKGFIRFSSVGWNSPYFLLTKTVRFKNGTKGVIYYEDKDAKLTELDIKKMYIDIGASSKEEALKFVKTGDVACFDRSFSCFGDRVSGKALDNRSACAVLVKVIEKLSEPENNLYFVFSSQEEIGLRGAKVAAQSILPDIALAVDVTDTGDTPECGYMDIKLGMGPAVKVMDYSVISDPGVRDSLISSASKNNIPYQLEVLEQGGTDAGVMQLAGTGIPAGGIAIPCRYIHSDAEVVSLDDLENSVRLILSYI